MPYSYYILTYWNIIFVGVWRFQGIWHFRYHVANLHQNEVNDLLKVIQGHPGLSEMFKVVVYNWVFHPLFCEEALKTSQIEGFIFWLLERLFFLLLKSSGFKLIANWKNTWIVSNPTWRLAWMALVKFIQGHSHYEGAYKHLVQINLLLGWPIGETFRVFDFQITWNLDFHKILSAQLIAP